MTRLARCVLWPLLLLAAPALAELSFDVRLEDVSGEGLTASDIQLSLQQPAGGTLSLSLAVGQIDVAAPALSFSGLRLSCPVLTVSATGYDCAEAVLSVADSAIGAQQIQADFHYTGPQDWRLSFSGLRMAGGRWRGELLAADGGWRGNATARGVQLERLNDLPVVALRTPEGWQYGGRLDLTARVSGSAQRLSALSLSLQGRDLRYAGPAGLHAGEAIDLDAGVDLQRQTDAWRGTLSGTLRQGQLYSDPVFVEVKQAATLDSRLRYDERAGRLAFDKLNFRWPDLLQLTADASVDLVAMTLPDLDLQASADDLSRLYPALLQPLLLDSLLEDAAMTGKARVRLARAGGEMDALSLELDDLHLDDRQGRFGVYGLDAGLHWRAGGDVPLSSLTLASGHVYQADIGAVETTLLALGDELRLTRPLDIPLLEGHLRLPRLQVQGLRQITEPTWQAAAEVEGVSLSLLSHALGWPVMSGELSGRIPGLSYSGGVLALDGELMVRALGGQASISGLRLTDPMGTVPVLEAEAEMHGLDLEAVTKVFSFGRITGSLDGEIRDLQLVGWQPTRFRADFYSSPGEGPPRRISQRAVDNLTELGNGFSAGLSSTFLRFFEDFAYDRIRLAVSLQGQTAELDGLAHKGGGYYLVKGRGLPRIDVVGRNRRVAWRDLVGRLKSIRFEGVRLGP